MTTPTARRRLPMLLGASFALMCTLVLYNVLDCFLGNYKDFDLVFGEVLLPCALGTAAGMLLLTTLLCLIPSGKNGRVTDTLIGVTASLAVAGWAQLTLLNGALGLMDGTAEPDFRIFGKDSLISLAVWLAVFVLIFLLRRLLKASWRKAVAGLLGTVLLMEAGSIVTGLLGTEKEAFRRNTYAFSFDEELTLSPEGNVILIVMDTFTNEYMNAWLDEYPEEADFLGDFTYYDNANANYHPTYPAVLHMLTAHPNDVTVPIDENCRASWADPRTVSSYRALRDAGWSCRLFFPRHESYIGGADGAALTADFFDNAEDIGGSMSIRPDRVWTELGSLALYRYLPQPLKKGFYDEASDVQTCVEWSLDGRKTGNYQNYVMLERLRDEGLTLAEGGGKYFVTQYLWGLHSPLHTSAQCEYVKDADSLKPMDTVRGLMLYLREYLDQLKALGIYDSSTVIVAADHGLREYPQAMFLIKEAGRRGGALTVSTAPIDYSDVLNTVLINAGVTPETGTSIYDFAPGDVRTRTAYIRIMDPAMPKVHKYHSTAEAKQNAYYAYTYTGDASVLNGMAERGEITEIVPLFESFD